MHSMAEGAHQGGGLRERKRAATRSAITAAARSLTARHGVHGFTVEQVCEATGVSRRTFFNYFPSKEDAILGHPGDHIPEDLAQDFIDGGSRDDGMSPTLLDDFVELAATVMERTAMSREEVLQLKEAIVGEPRLLDRFVTGSREQEQAFLGLLAARESLSTDDPRVQMASALLRLVTRRAAAEFFDPRTATSYREILRATVATLRAVVRTGPHP